MKKTMILASMLPVCLLTGYIFLDSEKAPKSEVLVENEAPMASLTEPTNSTNDESKLAVPPNRQTKSAEQIIAEAKGTDIITESINRAASSDNRSDMHQQLTQIATSFPALKEDVNDYLQGLNVQYKNLENYKQQISERNQQVMLDNTISDSLEYRLNYEKEQLLQEAKNLGKKAMALNEAIRQAAYNG